MNEIAKGISILDKGGIVIFPTDTAYGIGCRVDSGASVAKLFKIRKRPISKAVPVLVDGVVMAQRYWTSPLPDIVRHLIKSYWPGGLTIIYHANTTSTPLLVRGRGTTIGLRMPDHKVALAFIKGIGVGLIGTSANFSDASTPYRYEDLDQELVSHVDYVIKGKVKMKQMSTVVNCTVTPPKVVREGAVTIKSEILNSKS